MRSSTLICLCAALVASTSASPQFRIVDGVNADQGEWPWQLALYRGSSFSCGASIIASTWAISAAHCVGFTPNSYKILAGTIENTLNCDATKCVIRTLINATRHPNYSENGDLGYPNDISYLEWAEPIKEVQTNKLAIKYVPRATKNDQVGKNCYITGWGRIFGWGPLPLILQEAKIDVISKTDCQKIWGVNRITDKHVCVYDVADKTSGACNGDSGGPLVCETAPKKWELVGATSFGSFGCNTSYASVYTRISPYNDWLDAQAKPKY